MGLRLASFPGTQFASVNMRIYPSSLNWALM